MPSLRCPHCGEALLRHHVVQTGPLRPLRCKACGGSYIAGGLLPAMLTMGLAMALSGRLEGLWPAIGLLLALMLVSMAFLFFSQPCPAVHRLRLGVLIMVCAAGPPLVSLLLRLLQRG